MLLTINSNSVACPVLAIEVDGIKCRALIYAAAGSLYAYPVWLIKKPKKTCRKRMETLMNVVARKIDEIKDTSREFEI